jgi:hypothetical protein
VTQRLHRAPTRDPELVALAARLLETTDEFGRDVAAQIRARVDFYAGPSQVLPAELERSCRANVQFVLTAMRDDQTADVSAAEETGRIRAEQKVPLPVVMAAFRVGFNQIWTSLVSHARRQGLVTPDALVNAASDIWSVHDTFAEAMASAYRETAMAQALRDESERSALVAAVLEGRPLNETTMWNVADLLRLPSRGPFVVVAAEAQEIALEALPHAETSLRVHGIGSAWRLLPEMQVGIVRLDEDDQVPHLVRILDGLARGRVGISPTYLLLADTAAALRFARTAMASAAPGGVRVNHFDDNPLAVAAISAPEAVRHVTHAVLGAVLDLPPEQSTVLLQTLTAWRDNTGSAIAAAKQLFCHPNTVRQRLRKIESCTGRSLSDPQAVAEILLALEGANLLLPTSGGSTRL